MEVDTKVRGIVLNKLMAQAHKELDLKGKQMKLSIMMMHIVTLKHIQTEV